MRILFSGSGAFGLPTLKALHEQHQVVAVLTQPDQPAGRKRVLTPTPVGQWAEAQSLPVYKFPNANEPDAIAQITSHQPDAGVVIAYGQKLSEQLIAAMGKLAVNLHASLLPDYRGAAPINWAMIDGHKQTGNSVIALAQKMDAGDVFATNVTDIDPLETMGELHDRLSEMGPELILKVLEQLQSGTLDPQPQDYDKVTIARKLKKADGVIEDWSQSATQLRQRIHGLNPWPSITVQWHAQADDQPTPLKILRVKDLPNVTHDKQPGTVLKDMTIATGSGALELLEVQPAGKRPMSFSDFQRGNNMQPGDRLE
ncbi:MAG TPA: methionyl-tRNA formyltransferase [Phycisphaerales bacterium]|nr:methionyl-tRNA formyltransferase [Phycisphaerales bacterium]|tara:strand:+ start:140456 stop:141394 length:939 start_codon:yes stop_codon:yes gene_type:complete